MALGFIRNISGVCKHEDQPSVRSTRPLLAERARAAGYIPPSSLSWWARQPPYEAAFLEGFLGFIKMLIQRIPTKIPTKLPRGRRSVHQRAQSAPCSGRPIASDRTTKVARSLSVGKVFEVDPALAGRLSAPSRAQRSLERSLAMG